MEWTNAIVPAAEFQAGRRFREIVRKKTADGDDLERDVRRIVGSGRKLTFVFARFDPGRPALR